MLYSKVIGEGKPLIILHGFLGMSDNWKTLSVKYAESSLQVHVLDLRNHGRSFHADEFNYEVMMEDVVRYCQHNELTDVFLMGHSMGGKVAMKVACHHSDLVSKLIVADMSPKGYKPHHQSIMQALNAVDFTVQTTRTEIEDKVREYIDDEGVVQFLMKNVYRQTPDKLAFRFNLAAFNADDRAIGEALKEDERYDGPTLFLKGEQSNYITKEDETLIPKHFKNATIQTVSNAGHWLHAENPDEFYQLTIDFIEKS